MKVLTDQVSRYLYAILPFGVFGILHLLNANAMAGMVPIPGGAFWVYLTGVAHLAAAVSILIEKKTRLAGLLLGVMLIIFALSVHLPDVISSGGENAAAMTNFLKDTALAGGAWIIAGNYEAEGGSESATDTGHGGGESEFGGGTSSGTMG